MPKHKETRMLVLSRKIKESITLQTQEGIITISIKGIRGKQIKIGVDAPRSITVVRTDLLETLNEE
jgi:carbon storage regulator